MIKSESRQERNRHYRIIKPLDKEGAAYCLKMLSEKIPGFLDMKVRHVDDTVEYYYDITGKQLLKEQYEKTQFTYRDLQKFLKSIFTILRQAEWHLLNINEIVLDTDYIYVEEGKSDGQVCYLSGYEIPFREQLIGLVEWLLGKTDHHDQQAVQYIYGIYEMCREKEKSLLQIEKLVYKDVSSVGKREEKALSQGVGIKPTAFSMRYRICPENSETDSYVLSKACCILGRSKEKADIILSDATVSRVHAKMEFRERTWYIEDMNSMNGVYINRKKIVTGKQKKIKIGDVVSLGEFTFSLEKI